ncbi:hypothetical protein M011DRAFT_468503 [Sporormia fimetaria CBS 119925]|uniref:Uncharacterized protein n=1 Tax=Sporormia fimetaria CBS 119925 TaxID=1340428 RepID=A0A6A6V7C5_9PLEO|nr:hypothetical protein M011DRAFT_468503 [Sporormia fimetaria CBS 119925]
MLLMAEDKPPPATLPSLLNITVIWGQIAPYLPVSSVAALLGTSKDLRHSLQQDPDTFRYLDLSTIRTHPTAHLLGNLLSRLDETFDQSRTEDQFYAAPLRRIFSQLERKGQLRNVRTMILDGLSVTADLVHEIMSGENFHVRILSIREVRNMNERKLQQVLRYAVRPSRPEGTPRVKGIYVFGMAELPHGRKTLEERLEHMPYDEIQAMKAQWDGSTLTDVVNALAKTDERWYQGPGSKFPKAPSLDGSMFPKRPSLPWAQTLAACEGIIAFDAVLCRGPQHDPWRIGQDKFTPEGHQAVGLHSVIASVALGPAGCDTCHWSPEGPAQYGQSSLSQLPLLSPLPRHSSDIKDAQRPPRSGRDRANMMFARCDICLTGRRCQRCYKWWDEECYFGSASAQRTEMQIIEAMQGLQSDEKDGSAPKETIKIIGVRRDCFDCGPTCITCKQLFMRKCTKCKNEYCLEDNDASSETKCDWCNSGGRRTADWY